MKLEVQSVVNFVIHIIRLSQANLGDKNLKISNRKLKKFRSSLIDVLRFRYSYHWFPNKPFKGSGYRCIRVNDRLDPVIGHAAEKCGLSLDILTAILPRYLTIWVDPREVSYRIGDNGCIYVLYEYKINVTQPWKPVEIVENKTQCL